MIVFVQISGDQCPYKLYSSAATEGPSPWQSSKPFFRNFSDENANIKNSYDRAKTTTVIRTYPGSGDPVFSKTSLRTVSN